MESYRRGMSKKRVDANWPGGEWRMSGDNRIYIWGAVFGSGSAVTGRRPVRLSDAARSLVSFGSYEQRLDSSSRV